MIVYRIKHKPTGLFYTPVKFPYGNLSSAGKIYQKYPNIGCCEHIRILIHKPTKQSKLIMEYFGLDWENKTIDTHIHTDLNDCEIIEL